MANTRSPFKSNRDFLHDIKFEDNSRVFTVMRTKIGILARTVRLYICWWMTVLSYLMVASHMILKPDIREICISVYERKRMNRYTLVMQYQTQTRLVLQLHRVNHWSTLLQSLNRKKIIYLDHGSWIPCSSFCSSR